MIAVVLNKHGAWRVFHRPTQRTVQYSRLHEFLNVIDPCVTAVLQIGYAQPYCPVRLVKLNGPHPCIPLWAEVRQYSADLVTINAVTSLVRPSAGGVLDTAPRDCFRDDGREIADTVVLATNAYTESSLWPGLRQSIIPMRSYQLASRPLGELVLPATAALNRIGVANLRFEANPPVPPERARLFAEALIRRQQRAGLFLAAAGKISFLGPQLFRSTIAFPENVPTGTYLVEVFLVRDRDIVGGQTVPLVVLKAGVDAAVFDFATREPAAYGAIAVVTAVVAGWLASLPFRGF